MQAVALNTLFDGNENIRIGQKETEVRAIEMNPKIASPYDRTQASETVTCDIGNLKMPKPLALLVQTIKNQYPEMSKNAIINTVLTKNAQMLTAKRIKHVEKGNIGYCNYYAINFMPSGAGKDRMSYELDSFVYYPFRNWFKYSVQALKEQQKFDLEDNARELFPDENQQLQRERYIKEQMKEFGNIVLEVSDGTREGLFRDAKALI